MNKRNIKLEIAYDGTNFAGWQEQNTDRTVQGTIQEALSTILKTQIKINGSGRTDSGVHAQGQVANFYTENTSIPVSKFTYALNSLLPGDVRVKSSKLVDEDFHSRYSAVLREYKYYLYPSSTGNPMYRFFSYRIPDYPDISCLNDLLRTLVGSHDFTSFSALGDKSSTRVRNINKADAYMEGPFIVLRIAGNAFLWKMIRTIVGTVLIMEKNKQTNDDMQLLLDQKDRRLAGTTAPPWGLSLNRVLYPDSLDGCSFRRHDG